MAEKGDLGCIAGDPPTPLDYGSRSLVDRIAQILAPLMAVHCAAEKDRTSRHRRQLPAVLCSRGY
jgi:hypothetical protein